MLYHGIYVCCSIRMYFMDRSFYVTWNYVLIYKNESEKKKKKKKSSDV